MKSHTSYPWLEAALSAELATLWTVLILRNGLILSPDGWAYWEGSVSLLYGRGFHYFGGQDITSYPPLFSLYLALWQGLLGIRGSTLCAALAVTCGASAFIWVRLFRLLCGPHGSWLHSVLLIAFVPAFLAVGHAMLLSEALQLPLQGLLLLAIAKAMLRDEPPSAWRYWGLHLWLALLLFLLLLCRNSSLMFVPALGLFVAYDTWKFAGRSVRKLSFLLNGLAASLLVLVTPVAGWHVVRTALHQLHSHEYRGFEGRFSPVQYLWQILDANVFFLGPDFLGPVLFLALLGALSFAFLMPRSLPDRARARVIQFMLVFVACGVLVLYLIFNVTLVMDPLKGRYLWFVPLMLIGSAIALTTLLPRRPWRAWLTGLCVVLVAMQVFRAGCFAAFTLDELAWPRTRLGFVSAPFYDFYETLHKDDPTRLSRARIAEAFYDMYAFLDNFPGDVIQHNWTLNPDWYDVDGAFPGNSKEVGGAIVIAPANFTWIERE